MEEFAYWARVWVNRVLQFSRSGAALRCWVNSIGTDDWAKRNLPELDGIFTPRGLRSATEGRYWGGRERINCGTTACNSTSSLLEIYRGERARLANGFSIHPPRSTTWLQDRQLEAQADNNIRATKQAAMATVAFYAWRSFWEGSQTVFALSGNDSDSLERVLDGVLASSFRGLVPESGLPSAVLSSLKHAAFRQILRASFIHAWQITEDETGPDLNVVRGKIGQTPVPVVLAKPVRDALVVEWVHQRNVAIRGKETFGNGPFE